MKTTLMRIWLVLLLSGLAAGAGAAQPAPSLSLLLQDPSYRQLRISPDGQYYAMIITREGADDLVTVRAADRSLAARFEFREAGEEIGDYWWVKDHQMVMAPLSRLSYAKFKARPGTLYTADADGSNYIGLFGGDAGRKQVGTRIKVPSVQLAWGEFVAEYAAGNNQVLVLRTPWSSLHQGVGRGVESRQQLIRVRLDTGVSSPLIDAPAPNAQVMASPSGDVLLAWATDANNAENVFRLEADSGQWSLLASNTTASGTVLQPVSVRSGGREYWYLSAVDQPRTALFRANLDSGERSLVYLHDDQHVVGALSDPYTGEPYAVLVGAERRIVPLSGEHPLARLAAVLGKSFPDANQVGITSVTRDYRKAVVAVASARDPGTWYTADLQTRQLDLELANLPELVPETLASSRWVRFTARDGLPIAAVYTQPTSPAPAAGYPMVLRVHGGPYGVADSVAFNGEVQALATRGYAVLQVNFRGSGGYGDAFERAGYGEWGHKMQDDLADGVRWAIAEQLADPQRICIMGASYGGYAALMGLVRDAALYRCAVDYYGVTDLQRMASDERLTDALFGRAFVREALGEDRQQWVQRSPLRQPERFQAPVLIIAGDADEVVPVAHSRDLEQALRDAGKPVEAHYFRGEGHGFTELENRVKAMELTLDFLRRQLGSS